MLLLLKRNSRGQTCVWTQWRVEARTFPVKHLGPLLHNTYTSTPFVSDPKPRKPRYTTSDQVLLLQLHQSRRRRRRRATASPVRPCRCWHHSGVQRRVAGPRHASWSLLCHVLLVLWHRRLEGQSVRHRRRRQRRVQRLRHAVVLQRWPRVRVHRQRQTVGRLTRMSPYASKLIPMSWCYMRPCSIIFNLYGL